MFEVYNATFFSIPVDFVKPYFNVVINSDVVQKTLQVFDDVLDDNPLLSHAVALSGGVLIGKSLGEIHTCKGPYLQQIAATIFGLAFAHLAISNATEDTQCRDDWQFMTTYSTCLAGVCGGVVMSFLRSHSASRR